MEGNLSKELPVAPDEEVRTLDPLSSRGDDDIALSNTSQMALDTAKRRAQSLGQSNVTTDDILWGLFHGLDQRNSLALKFMKTRGITENTVYADHGYTNNAQEILELAAKRAIELNRDVIGTEDLLYALFSASQQHSNSGAIELLYKRGVTKELVFGTAELSFNVQKALQSAIHEAQRLGHDRVGSEDLLWALFQKTDRDSRARHWLGAQGIFSPAETFDSFRNEPIINDITTPVESRVKSFMVGMLAGSFETLLLQPFVYWKTVAQLSASESSMSAVWNLSNMYRGVVVNCASIGPISAVQYTGHKVLTSLYENTYGKSSASAQLVISGLAGATSSVIVTPAELLMISQQRLGGTVMSQYVDIVKSNGWAGLYRGWLPTLLRETGWTFGFLGLTPNLTKILQDDSKFFRSNGVAATAAASVIGGQVAAVVTQPFDTLKTLEQADRGMTREKRFSGMPQAARNLWATEGVSGFWKGISARSVRLTLAVFILGQTQETLTHKFTEVGFT
eukprot:m.138360 g.138360  ORF g.138360 m.138360 type:complete len:508 (-) comp29986_c0_seq1:214-1737(-)